MTPAEIASGIVSVRAAIDFAKGLAARAEFIRNSGEIEKLHHSLRTAHQIILALQGREATLVAERDEAKRKTVDLEKQLAKKEQYKLIQLRANPQLIVFAYAPNPTDTSPAPPHWVCAACGSKGQYLPLNNTGSNEYVCPGCDIAIYAPQGMSPAYGQP